MSRNLVVLAVLTALAVPALRGLFSMAREGRHFRQPYTRGYCFLCAQPNRPGHGCAVSATANVQRHVYRSYGRMGRLRKALWRGEVSDRFGTLWRCSHGHLDRQAAIRCAQSSVREMQRTPKMMPPVSFRRQGTESPPKRLPISDLSEAAWRSMVDRAGGRCFYCGEESTYLEKEHVIPLARGGANSATNIVPSCPACNRRKGTLTGAEFLRLLAGERVRRNPLPGKRRYHIPSRPTSDLLGRPFEEGDPPLALIRFEECLLQAGLILPIEELDQKVLRKIAQASEPSAVFDELYPYSWYLDLSHQLLGQLVETTGSLEVVEALAAAHPNIFKSWRNCIVCRQLKPQSGMPESEPDRSAIQCSACEALGTDDRRVLMGEKRCTTCKAVKPRSEFGSNRSRGDGLDNKCRMCVRQRSRDSDHRQQVRRENIRRGKEARQRRDQRLCSVCGADREAADFLLDRDRSSGLGVVCKNCRTGGSSP